MIKFNFTILIYLIIFLKIQCDGKLIHVEVKIKDDWKEKREFFYLKNVEIKDRFLLKAIEKKNNQRDSFNKNIEGYLRSIDLNLDKNMFEVGLSDISKYIPSNQLKKKILIEITNNEIIQNFLPGFEKMLAKNVKSLTAHLMLPTSLLPKSPDTKPAAITTLICVKFKVHRDNNFIENDNCYETSILDKNEKNNYFSIIEKNMENYKNKVLSSYWTEINLIGYKIELLAKQNVEYHKELKSRIIYLGNKISVINEKKKRDCFNCGVRQIKTFWQKYLKEHYLCHTCGDYKQKLGKHRHKSLFIKNKKEDRHCYKCGIMQAITWVRHSELGQYLCKACYDRERYIKKKSNTNKNGNEADKRNNL
uniref:GATA-type domain-containing protein n=1 Tax=Meloidogyne enterolobii TaxID=390850 RepID=A0A6V7WLX2_MELEN|nr:unnamed protein product [Meloidogyne enterolobii]